MDQNEDYHYQCMQCGFVFTTMSDDSNCPHCGHEGELIAIKGKPTE